MKNSNKILISFLLVVKNEEKHIKECLNSIINQDFAKDEYEIIIVDNNSSDKTLEIIEKVINNKQIKHKIIINNDNTNLSRGWNLAINESIGKYVVRIDGHSYVPNNFLKINLETFEKEQSAVCVGGKINTISSNKNKVITNILSSPFGIGNSKFRYSDNPGFVDTVPYGMYKKNVFNKVGLFNENFNRTQDIEMNKRIRQNGGRIYFNPKIISYYYSKDTYKKLFVMAFTNGKWTMYNAILNVRGSSARHFIPLMFVLGLLFGSIVSMFNSIILFLFLIILCFYFLLAAFFSFKKSKNIIIIFKMIFTFFIFHFLYGIGSIIGLFTYISFKEKNK